MRGRELYLRTRRIVRGLVHRFPAVDMAIGRRLVRVDEWLRKRGLVKVVDASTRSFEVRGATFGFDEQNRAMADAVLTTGEYETETLEAIERLLSPGAGFADLGANIGFFTVLGARAVGAGGKVYAFEPTPATAAVLRRNVDANGVAAQVELVEAAVSAAPGRARFAIYASAAANAIAVDGDDANTIDVEVTSLDAYFGGRGWPRVDLVKMDVEGQELAVFRGMRELVARNPSIRVIFEYHRSQLARAAVGGRELIEAVRGLGFDTFEALFRKPQRLDLPAELDALDRIAARANLNVLAWRA
jgi:FkbM family methyltransferase